MATKTGKMICVGNCAGSLRPDHPVDLAHYLRQAAITHRRHSTMLNYVWCKHRQLGGNFNLWKH